MLSVYNPSSTVTASGLTKAEKYRSSNELQGADFTDEELRKPSKEEIEACTARTAAALNLAALSSSTVSSNPKLAQPANLEPVFVRYLPSQSTGANNSGAKERIIRIQEIAQDPLAPSRFKIKKDARRPPSPPTTVLHSPTRKATKEELEAWHIPTAVSSWKNKNAFIIELDKRVAFDGNTLKETQVSDKFATFVEALYVTERTARKEVEARASLMRRLEERKREEEDRRLEQLALGVRSQALGRAVDDEERAREQLREERAREIEREYRLQQHRHAEEGERRREERERDVSERVALGGTVAPSGARFDERLFHRDEGGRAAGMGGDESSSYFDKPLFSDKVDRNIYTYRGGPAGADAEANIAALQARGESFEDERGRTLARREAPVQFEKAGKEGESGGVEAVARQSAAAKEREERRYRSRSRSVSPDRKRRKGY